ncbi:MAG TPA: formate/nitrite transporter family protein [Thermoanaerobaculia bacterium]|nr:formate/nitrite transporter family protein [Thermoanaerobaculia bacterium]
MPHDDRARDEDRDEEDEKKKVEEQEKKESEELKSPSGSVVYQAICHEGQSELERSSSALAWSGLAAGLSMGFSFLGAAVLHAYTPEAKWQPLVTNIGYTLGFLIVILGRQQLFTENTLTVILPLLREKKAAVLKNVLRLWTVVLLANLAGALLFAFALAKLEVVDPEVFEAMRAVARHAQKGAFSLTLLRGIYAGWLIALMVWLLPFAESARVWVIMIITWLVGVSSFAHVVAGAVEAAFLVFVHESGWSEFALGFFIPALLGNIIGGVSLVAAINHAQVVAGEQGEDA